jgi:translocation and assembly module TamB
MSRKRLALISAGSVAAVFLLITAALVVVAQSSWFSNQVRARIVSTVEEATGGHTEVGSFRFDWRRLSAQAGDLVIHGTEPSGKPPLFSAKSIAVGLKVVSFMRREVDVQSVDVVAPRIYLTVDADGNTNIPQPRIRRKTSRNTLETILDASIGRFSVTNGIFEVESRSRTPFSAQGSGFQARFDYELAGPRYRGDVRMHLSKVRVEDYEPTDVDIASKLVLEKSRIAFSPLTLDTGKSHFELAGALEDLNKPRVSLRYTATVSQDDVARFLKTKLLESGTVRLAGDASWAGANNFSVRGNLNGYGLEYRDAYVRLTDFRADGALTGGPHGVEVNGLRLSGSYVRPGKRIPADVRIAGATIHSHRIEFRGLAISIFGGMFDGNGALDDLDHFQAAGDVTGFQARRVVAVYSDAELPWDGRASGPIQFDARIKRDDGIALTTNLTVAPEPGSAPVSGQITAAYDSRTKLLDLGRSALTLPSSRASFSGVIGRELRVHFESRDLADVLPAIGVKPESVPLAFRNGSAIFDGTVSGPLADPRIAGKLSASQFTLGGDSYDSFSADALASPANVALNNALLTSGGVRLQFQGALKLTGWKPEPANDIFGNGVIRNAPAPELAEFTGWRHAPLEGAVNVNAQFTGSVSKPIIQGSVEIGKGRFEDEPFDRFAGNLRYVENTLALTGGQITAGAKQVKVTASYRHDPSSFKYGRLTFDAATNSMQLEQIKALQDFRPGFRGTVQASSSGVIDLRPERKGERGFAITELRSEIDGSGLEYEGKAIGNARITATSDGRTLRASLDAGLVESTIHGEGSWQLQGDYPGNANVQFARLNIARLGNFISPRKTPGPAPYEGSADGQVSLDGPALRPEQIKARLSVASLQLAPASEGAPANRGTPLVIRNEGPVVATLAGKVISVEKAHLVGRATDVSIAGKIGLEKSGFDLRANGRIDLGLLEDFSSGLTSAGTLIVNATLRGPLGSPQIGGRVEVQDASLTIDNFPNSFSAAKGVILFSGDQATIQSLRGESGGGTVDISGSVAYTEGQLVFHLDLDGRGVRVRYPEGISTVSNARLNLRGTGERSMLTGNITILRTGVNLESDFGSVLARSAEPVETPPARTGILGGMNLDVSIASAPDVEVRSSMTQDVAAEANLRLRGTATNPVLQGRVNIIQGQVLFLGAKYNVSRGSIEFYNPVRVEPVLNVDLETKAKGVDITLTLSGPVKKLNLTPRSDPPLPLNDILSLLATGQTGSSDTALAQRNSTSLPWQQMGATALLGQVITSPVAGRLQRFFGVSRLRIDPSLPGVENNPQARFTVEQQITPDITFTYITVVNSSNPQVVRMEWDFSKQWSVVALREENGQFGMDFYYKRQFK